MGTCTGCGKALAVGEAVCSACGTVAMAVAPPPPPPPPPGPLGAPGAVPPPYVAASPVKGGRPKWLAPVAVAVVAAIIGVVVWQATSKDDTKSAPKKYTAAMRQNFVDECASTGGTVEICGCVFDEIKVAIPYDEFLEMDKRAATDDTVTDDPRVVAAIQKCMA